MEGFLAAAASALWLGILTSISPCPLATNIAAISFIGRRVGNPRRVFFTGLLYALGRIAAYVILGIIIVASLLSSSEISLFLQKYLNRVLGPILILVGMVLLELIPLRLPGGGFGDGFQRRAERFGMWGAAVLGFVFALSFCPLSAALFFGSLIPLSLEHGSRISLPALYGLGTGLPVLVFAVVISFGAQSLGRVFSILTGFEKWARYVTGAIFIMVGVYYCLIYIFRVL